MASNDELVKTFEEFCMLEGANDKSKMTARASRKLVADCFDKGYKKYDVKSIVDIEVFPALRDIHKQYMTVNKANVDKYIKMTAHGIVKKKTGNNGIAEDDLEVETVKEELVQCVLEAKHTFEYARQAATSESKDTVYVLMNSKMPIGSRDRLIMPNTPNRSATASVKEQNGKK